MTARRAASGRPWWPSGTGSPRSGSLSRASRRFPAARGDRGAVTAELAIALPAVVLVLAVLLVTGAAAATQLRCADAARAGARVAALGQGDAQVAEVARRVGGATLVVAVERADPWVEVVVSTSTAGAWFTGGRLAVSASATAWVEP